MLTTCSQPKSAAKPKSATDKAATNGTVARGAGSTRGRGGRRGRNANRPKPKTADELDAEMVDYFDTNATNGAVGSADGVAANPADGGDELGMGEISVNS